VSSGHLEAGDRRYIEAVRASAAVDPSPTIRALADHLGLDPDEVAHHVLVEWAASGAAASLATGPLALRQLRDAVEAGDLDKVRGIVDWLLAGFEA
jgi:hypothetical protein